METLNQLNEQFELFTKDYEKFAKGNSAAGTRARKALGEIGKLCKTIRGEISDEKAARKEVK
jgi:hypothetical protein